MSKVKLQTSKGDIVLQLNTEKAPISAENFIGYVNDGFYDGTIFHRVIDGFMIQGGGFNEQMIQKPTKGQIKNEADNGLKNSRGTVAMARTQVVDSATSQFFINLVDNSFLNFSSPTPSGYGYAVFGEITEGLEIIDEIAKVATGMRGGHQDVPTDTITIVKAEVLA
ncbi:MAG: cyclophilin [Desulfuromonas sp.]|mgnify:CR=1 FL=1|nr:MAG: cyclophilin [Desulfuromonas sp.]